MATIIGVGMQMTASASGMTKGLSEAEKSLRALQNSAKDTQRQFREFSGVLSVIPGPLGDIAGRISGLSSAGEGLSRVFGAGLTKGLSSLGEVAAGLNNKFTIAAAGVAAFGAAAVAVTRGLVALEDRVESLGNTADKLGVSFEFIQTLEEAANRSGTSIEAVSSAFGSLQKNVTGVDEESKAAQTALQGIGVTVEQLQSLKPEDQYKLIGERLEAISDPAKRTAAAIQLFGKSGTELLPFFKNIGGAATDMERFGRALTEIDRRRIDEFGAGLDALGVATQGLGQSLLLPFVGLGEGVSKAFAEIIAGLTSVIDPIGRILEPILTNVGRAIEALGFVLGNFGRVVGLVFEPFADAAQEISRIIDGIGSSVGAFVGDLLTIAESYLGIERSAASSSAAIQGVVAQTKQLSAEEKKVAEERGRVFQRLREEVNNAIDDSRKFGEEGRAAAYKYDAAVEQLRQRLSSELIDDEQFRRSVRIAGQVFDEEIKRLGDRRQLELKVKEDAAKTIEKVGDEIDKAAIKAEGFGKAGQQAFGALSQRLDGLRQQFAAELIDDKQLEKAVAAANREYDKQIEKIKQANQERQRAAEEDRKRSAAILDEMDKTRAVQRDIDTVQREINKLRAESARGVLLSPEQRQQLQDLQQAQVELGEKQRAVAKGFEQGYGEAFDKTQEKFLQLAEKADEFGAAGAAAAQRLAEGLNAAAEQARRNGSAEQYELEVQRQQRLYENELKNLKTAADERKKTNEFIEQELLLISVNGDSKRAEAKKNLLAIEQEIARVQKEMEAARKSDDSKALQEATKRLAQLDQVAAKERDIASGAAGQREEQQKRFVKAQEQQQQQIQQAQQAFQQELARQQQAEYERQVKRITELNTLGSQTVQTADIRTQEGAALVLNLAANAQDPALIEARLQSKYLREINENIRAEANERSSRIVAIAGANFTNTFN